MKNLKLFSLVTVFCALLLSSACTRIEPGYEGFKYSYAGTDKGKPEVQPAIGWTGYVPGFSTVREFPVSVQHWEGEVTIFCKLGAELIVPLGYNYQVIPGKSADIFFQFKTDDLNTIASSFLFNTLRNNMNNVSGTITLDSVISDMPKYRAQVNQILVDSFASYGFKMDQFGFTGAPKIVDDQIRSSVSNKITAKQNAETAVTQLQISVAEANKRIADARGDSASAVIRASGEAEAIRKTQQALTPGYIDYIKWSNWDGKMPQTMMAGSAGLLISPK